VKKNHEATKTTSNRGESNEQAMRSSRSDVRGSWVKYNFAKLSVRARTKAVNRQTTVWYLDAHAHIKSGRENNEVAVRIYIMQSGCVVSWKGLATINAYGALLGRVHPLGYQDKAVQRQEHIARHDCAHYVPYDVDVSALGMAQVVPPVARSSKRFLVATIRVRP